MRQRWMIGGAALLLGACASAQPPATAGAPLAGAPQAGALTDRVRAILDKPALAGARWGLLVVDDAGREMVAIDPDGRFMPASNTKLYSIAAVMSDPALVDGPLEGTAVALEPRSGAAPDVVLLGAGDPFLSDAADCARDCLSELADAVAAKTKTVGDVIGDDRLYLHERWGGGVSWNNLQTRFGTATSALTLNENTVALRVEPGAPGQPPRARFDDGWFAIDNDAVTGGKTDLSYDRQPDSRTVRLTGTIALDAQPQTLTMGVDDPAAWTASRFAALLRARGVKVGGVPRARHRLSGEGIGATPAPIARLTPPPILDSYTRTMKVSQNLHAELLLRRAGAGDPAKGLEAIEVMLARAGAPRNGWELADGSGMSTYNRVSPRTTVTLLRWSQAQPWGAAYRATMPVGGVDGTLSNRFKGTPLERRVFAKTGSINATNALAGFFETASGRTMTFALYANDVPASAGSATPTMDEALNAIAAAL